MKALAYVTAHPLSAFSIDLVEVPAPSLRPHDVLVEVRAFSVNPVDYKVRSSRTGTADAPVILGWDGAGIVRAVGPEATFAVGDEVYFAGDLTRAGTYAEQVAVDSRLIARKPTSLSFAEAAALPLTALTAWEALIARRPRGNVLVVGGAGGVGSIAIQLLKAKTDARVFATASRPETIAWVRELGADVVVDHRAPLKLDPIDHVFSTTHTQSLLPQLVEVLRPFGSLALIDDPPSLDIVSLKRKSLSVHWELMFTKSLYNVDLASQGEILAEVAALVDAGKLRTTLRTHLEGFTPANVRAAHELQESGTAIGKTVISR